MKTRIALFAVVAFALLLPVRTSAQQYDVHAPGIYAVVGEEYVPLNFTKATVASFGVNYVSLKTLVHYKGATSGTTVNTSTFVLVVDPNQKTYKAKKPFVRELIPSNLVLLPLISNPGSKRREFDPGISANFGFGLIYEEQIGIPFEWERITDNSFLIKVNTYLPAGEFGFATCLHRYSSYDYYKGAWGFTIPKAEEK